LINTYLKKKLIFILGEINYNLITIDFGTNSSLENYNKIMKDSLGKKKGESVKIQNKLIT